MDKFTIHEVRPYNGMVYKLAVPNPPRDAHEENIARTGAFSHVQDVLLALCSPGDLVVDVGVNIGSVAVPLALKGINVIGYDILPDNLATTAAAAEANGLSDRIELRHAAVWHEAGRVSINGANSLQYIFEGKGVPVRAVALSSEFRKDDRFSALKVDVEGCELNVFRGARAHLEAYHPHLVFEVYPKGMADYGTSVRELMRFLEGLGYSIYRMTQFSLCPGYEPPAEQLVTDYLATTLSPEELSRKTGFPITTLSASQIVMELELQALFPVGHRRYVLAVRDTLPAEVRSSPRVAELLDAWEAELGRDPEITTLRKAVYG